MSEKRIIQVLLGWIPNIGNAINATTAAGVTEAAGSYFANLSDEEFNKYKTAKEDGYKEAKAEFDAKLKK